MTPSTPPDAPRATMNRKPVFWRPAKTVINMKSGFEHKLLCDGPTFSTGVACTYSCSFCYVPAAMHKLLHDKLDGHKHMDVVVRRENAIQVLEKQLRGLSPEVKAKNLVIYSSPLVDVAGNVTLADETAEACLAILNSTRWQIRLLSKSNLLPRIASSLTIHKDRLIFGVSTGTLDDRQAAAFEQGCPKVSKRLESLYWLQDHGFRTFGMVCPTLPQRDYLHFAAEVCKAIRADRCEHVWAEVINVRGESMTRTCQALHEAGYEGQAAELQRCAADPEVWERHAQHTFSALAAYMPAGKLRFLQYPKKHARAWWQTQVPNGAVLLGAHTHA